MKITVLSRYEIEAIYDKITEPCIIISIYCPADTPARIEKTEFVKDILFLAFDDVEEDRTYGYKPMSKEDGVLVRDFVEKFKNEVNEIIVHCDAGVSRSAGIAAAIGKYLNGDDMFIFGRPRYCPNLTCYRNTFNAFFTKSEVDQKKFSFNKKVFKEVFLRTKSEEEFNNIFITSQEELDEWLKEKNQVI